MSNTSFIFFSPKGMILLTFHRSLSNIPYLANSWPPWLVWKVFYAPRRRFLFKVSLLFVRICLSFQRIWILDVNIYLDNHTISQVWWVYTYSIEDCVMLQFSLHFLAKIMHIALQFFVRSIVLSMGWIFTWYHSFISSILSLKLLLVITWSSSHSLRGVTNLAGVHSLKPWINLNLSS